MGNGVRVGPVGNQTFDPDYDYDSGTVGAKLKQSVNVLDKMTNNQRAAWLLGSLSVDHASAIQAADDDVAALDGGTVNFPPGPLLIASNIERSPVTSWVGPCGGLDSTATSGTRLYAGFDGILVSCGTSHSSNVYCRNVQTKGLHFVGDLTNYPNATAMKDRLVRQRVYEDITITSFYKGHELVTCGEIYRKRMFISGCHWSRYESSLSDSWTTDCHFGSGITTNPTLQAIYTGGSGVYSFGGASLTEVGCRYQVQYGGYGATFIGCQGLRLNVPIADASESGGILLEGCRDVDVIAPRLYNNGASGGGAAQIVVRTRTATCVFTAGNSVVTNSADINARFVSAIKFVTDGSLPPELTVDTTYWIGGNLTGNQFEVYPTFDDAFANTNKITPSTAGVGNHSFYLASDLIRISRGSSRSAGAAATFLGFQKVSSSGALSASASLGSIDVDGHDVTGITAAFGSASLAASGLKARLITSLGPILTANSSGITVFPDVGYKNVVRTSALAADVSIALTPTALKDDRVRFFRDTTATGAFNWNITISGVTVATLSTAGTSCEFVGSGGSWTRVG